MACARKKTSRSGGEGAPILLRVWHKGEELQQVAAVEGAEFNGFAVPKSMA